MSCKRIMLILVFEPICSFYEIPAALRGVGYSALPAVETILGTCIFRIVWVYTIFAYFHTIPSLYLLYPCSWALTAAAEIAYFVFAYRQSVQRLQQRDALARL